MRRPLLAALPCLLWSALTLAADPPTVQAWPQQDPPAPGYAVLNITRMGLQSGNACDIDLYVRGELLTRLQPDGSVALNLTPGEVPIRLATASTGACRDGMQQLQTQTLKLRAGEIRSYRVGFRESGYFLTPINTP
ncbi:hypothetical protein [Pseudomonas citronellolis]|uniref:hypothetical protein n=1 Tax=Pseudomonas citronellolis TaxID=53408 RepID=UPI0023E3DD65|nr:hypothetical protein [Pseudomonas citronellolis]MDF3933508.1 hypothetical protein [Pseudomonas citronellolis]